MCLSALFLASLSLGMPAGVEWKGVGQEKKEEEERKEKEEKKKKVDGKKE